MHRLDTDNARCGLTGAAPRAHKRRQNGIIEMHILIGLAMAAALLYFWLLGHWFARVLVFLLLGAALGVGGMVIGMRNDPVGGFLLGALGIVAAWFSAGIPIYYWRYRLGYPSKLREYIEFERP
jgi:hypothetical protein